MRITIHKKFNKLFPPNSPKFSRTLKKKIGSNSSNSSPNRVILFAAISNHLLLDLFWQFITKEHQILHCPFLMHPWWIEISCTWSNFELGKAFQSTHLSFFFICLEEFRAKTSRFNAAFKLRWDFESHGFVNCYMHCVDRSS